MSGIRNLIFLLFFRGSPLWSGSFAILVIQQDFLWSGTLAYIYCIRSNQILGNTTILGIGCVYITEAPDAVMAASFVVILCNPIYFDAHKADPYNYQFISENTILLHKPTLADFPAVFF